jgi:type I restriction enzyme S subunit
MFTSFLNKVFNNHLTELNMKSLDKLFNIQIGRTPSRGDKQLWDTKKTTNNIWLSIKDLNNIDENGFISDSFEYISKKAESSVPLVPENTLLLSFKLTLGRTAISKVPLRTNEAIAALLPKTNTYDINYLKYYFEYFDFIKFAKNDFKVKGLTLNKKKLAEIKIPIIPFQEQNEAVKQLNQISNSVKTLISNYEEQLLLLSNLKKSYLIKEFSYE